MIYQKSDRKFLFRATEDQKTKLEVIRPKDVEGDTF